MAGTSRNRTRDTLLLMLAAGLIAASAASATILDLKGGASSGSLGQGPELPSGAVLLVDVTALEIASGDEFYSLILQGSPDADFGTAGNIVELGQWSIGAKGPRLSDADKDDAIGRYIFPVTNERNGTTYRYLRLYVKVAGTIATGINLSAYLCKG